MLDVTECLRNAQAAIIEGNTQRAIGQLNLALTFAQAQTVGSKCKHRIMRGYIAQAETALRRLG